MNFRIINISFSIEHRNVTIPIQVREWNLRSLLAARILNEIATDFSLSITSTYVSSVLGISTCPCIWHLPANDNKAAMTIFTMCRSQITRDLIDGNTSVASAPMPGATVENVVNMTGQSFNSLARASYLKLYDGTQIKTVFAPGEYTIPRFDSCPSPFLPESQIVLHPTISMVLCQDGLWSWAGASYHRREKECETNFRLIHLVPLARKSL